MKFTLSDVLQGFAILAALVTFMKTCWHIAEFAIGARKDIATLTATVSKIEKNLDEGLEALQERVAILERKDDIRHALEHEGD